MAPQALREPLQSVRRSARAQRLIALAPRYLAAGALAITSSVGIRELIAPAHPAAPSTAPLVSNRTAEDFALEFARAYLSYDASRPELRQRALARFRLGELGLEAGSGASTGSRAVLWANVSDVRPTDRGQLVVVAAQTDRERRPLHLAVSLVRRPDGALALDRYPAFVGASAVGAARLAGGEEVEEPGIPAVARRAIANYLAGQTANLKADLLAGVEVLPPAESLRVRGVQEIAWQGTEPGGSVLITVLAVDEARVAYTLTYELGVVEQAGRAYVSFIELSESQSKETG